MMALSIVRDFQRKDAGLCLQTKEGYLCVCIVPDGYPALSTRPDPIHRAWVALEAKRAMGGNIHAA